jgi:predicted alpha/beta superfamily hydrolase
VSARRVTAAVVLSFAVVASAAVAATVPVTFVVDVPASTPAGAVVWVSGDATELGQWNGAGVKLAPTAARRYSGSVALAASTPIEYKVTRGSWDTVEKDSAGGELANRTWRVAAAGADTVRITVAEWRDHGTGAAPPPKHSTRTGDVRAWPAFASKYVRARDVLVWLPPGYDADATRRYPVLYFHDGQNMLDDSTSFAGEWQLDEMAARGITIGAVAPFIAVCVANTPDRMSDYTPVADARHGGGKAGDYARFLIEELKPAIDRAYRTRTDAASTGIVGSSLGGLVSLAIACDHPEVFGRVGAVSPSAWWGDRWLVKRARTAPRSLRVWLDIGTAEGGAGDDAAAIVGAARDVHDALLAAGVTSLHYEEVTGARHNETAWAERLGRILTFLLPAD